MKPRCCDLALWKLDMAGVGSVQVDEDSCHVYDGWTWRCSSYWGRCQGFLGL